MHISDGVLSAPVWISGYIITAGIAASGIKKMKAEDMPKVAVMTSAFFVASLIHIPLGPTSVHLILNGFIGIILGPLSFISILIGLTLQAMLFQHGGITTIGINTIVMGIPALLCYRIFNLHKGFLFGAIAGASGILMSTILLAVVLITTGTQFIGVAKYAALAHIPVMIIEGIITGFIVLFLLKVKPEILQRRLK